MQPPLAMSLLKRCQCLVQVRLRCFNHISIMLLLMPLSLVMLCNESCGSAIGGNNVSIETDILHFSYELERSWLDTSIRPCQDFYGFVCGKSLNISETQFEMERQQKFEQFLDKEDDEHLMDAELKLKQFYVSCKEARSTDDLKGTFMYRSAGGWPAIDDATSMIRKRRNMTWLDVLGVFHEAGFEYFFKTHIEIKSNKRILYLEPDENMRYTLRKFEQLASEVLQEHSVEPVRARLVELEIMNFERNRREIAKLATKNEGSTEEFTYGSLKTTYFGSALQPDWDAFFKRILGKVPKSSDIVRVRQLQKLVQYFELLQKTTMTRFMNWLWIDYLMDKSSSECKSLVRVYFEPVYEHIVERAVIDKKQMAQIYADIGRAYDEVLTRSTWIDEMSQQLSKQFHGRIMHLTLNGDTQLDSHLVDVTVTKRNFYRNLEKMQRHLMHERKIEHLSPTSTQSHKIFGIASEFMKIFLTVGALLRQQNLTTPLNYFLVGERFAKYMISSGSTSTTSGAWRSMDSEREFATFRQCLARTTGTGTTPIDNRNDELSNNNLNELLLRILAEHQTWHALDAWRANNAALWQRLDRLLAAGKLQLTLRKLYFVGSLLINCRHNASGNERREIVHSYLRNSQAFTQAFGCRASDKLYAPRNSCKVL